MAIDKVNWNLVDGLTEKKKLLDMVKMIGMEFIDEGMLKKKSSTIKF